MISLSVLVLLALPCFTWSRELRGYIFDSLFRWKSHTPTGPSPPYSASTYLSPSHLYLYPSHPTITALCFIRIRPTDYRWTAVVSG
ncbi:hypothetical protein BO82DRAFT_136664 [Aspergillus uvarum CBS 121591]|uniref:Secreted protein n=1 Tax=Aspergillus uvarum CBS 121591 TaxID=1448315 RepID=A0A319C2A8_9EURO|nr:hypothetical protein BO82DRAFT_136664 [Aspergillus uvarum CBS 121591]PYH79225.1 hypothetical protein BO82DRAFT_136664 [Aspergillus uvarum CBS 121591]